MFEASTRPSGLNPGPSSQLNGGEREALVETIGRNCDISDARHAGMYSICGLALRLRDLYKWKTGLEPWQEGESATVLDWIGKQEARWESLSECDFVPIPLNGRKFDPFDTEGLNAVLEPFRLFYGAGYAYGMKPSFFLASVSGRHELEGHAVVELGRELARDMLTLPALTQGGTIVWRKEASRMWLWDRMQYVNASGRPALSVALASAGVRNAKPHRQLKRLLDAQKDAFLYHELAELKGDVLPSETWRLLMADLRQTPAEIFVRAVRDLLADTAPDGTLIRLIRNRNTTALALYTAFFEGLAREMFPELRRAFVDFVESGNWRSMETAVSIGYERAAENARRVAAVYHRNGDRRDNEAVAREIEETLLRPLTRRSDKPSDAGVR
jgi:hypothetical protein